MFFITIFTITDRGMNQIISHYFKIIIKSFKLKTYNNIKKNLNRNKFIFI